MPRALEIKSMTQPIRVTSCMGTPEKEVILRMAYLTRLHRDHLEVLAIRSWTSKGIAVVLKPTHEERVRKKEAQKEFLPMQKGDVRPMRMSAD